MKSITGINLIFHSICPGGGMERYVIDIMAEFARKGIQVRGIARKAQWPGLKPAQIELVTIKDKTPFSRLNNLIFERIAHKQRNPSWPTIAISRITQNADIAISGGTHIGHLHAKGKSPNGIFNQLAINHEKLLYKNAKKIITHSKKVENEIISLYNQNPERITTLYPPIDTKKFNQSTRKNRQKTRERLQLTQNDIALFFPSNNHTLKGANLILDTIDHYKMPIKLLVAGKSPLKHKKAINLGHIKNIEEIYAAADATILASKYEAFGLVAPESILCGTPVLLAKGIGATEAITHPACITFERTEESLQKAILSLSCNKKITDITDIKYECTLEHHASKIIEILTKINQ
ncbi:glycosyltransferase family 4 protein [Laribacter hongkongensis]|uniref:glycosyltransferase family 4 protein n=1 Tax=Laribacter hongkongensis TaxID=168471 RepID=UPI001EFE340B|nr:glycosyltransferase family 4 protein [Laribacter hongkongensis]MCG8993142.1 glycosyltransferase family 4 protein [Laribacter hongkongensis]MCG8998366.1 glycosyltransferase family 4 protein [Laribacter hongkongensis]MCG9000653.1 glycosyltransferase family 4 protein [Laribacter hongkongensis]MCG9003830.1 glycosyltransferase family 4 protein [Laribacter hongkongensis]MCG9007265.1 glycosyltransferase family 4 protein [Laribacter hongkongensis]